MKIGLIADTRQDSEDSTATFSGVLETDLEEVDDIVDSEDDLAEQDPKDDDLEMEEDESILCSSINHVKEIGNNCIGDSSVDNGEVMVIKEEDLHRKSPSSTSNEEIPGHRRSCSY